MATTALPMLDTYVQTYGYDFSLIGRVFLFFERKINFFEREVNDKLKQFPDGETKKFIKFLEFLNQTKKKIERMRNNFERDYNVLRKLYDDYNENARKINKRVYYAHFVNRTNQSPWRTKNLLEITKEQIRLENDGHRLDLLKNEQRNIEAMSTEINRQLAKLQLIVEQSRNLFGNVRNIEDRVNFVEMNPEHPIALEYKGKTLYETELNESYKTFMNLVKDISAQLAAAAAETDDEDDPSPLGPPNSSRQQSSFGTYDVQSISKDFRKNLKNDEQNDELTNSIRDDVSEDVYAAQLKLTRTLIGQVVEDAIADVEFNRMFPLLSVGNDFYDRLRYYYFNVKDDKFLKLYLLSIQNKRFDFFAMEAVIRIVALLTNVVNGTQGSYLQQKSLKIFLTKNGEKTIIRPLTYAFCMLDDYFVEYSDKRPDKTMLVNFKYVITMSHRKIFDNVENMDWYFFDDTEPVCVSFHAILFGILFARLRHFTAEKKPEPAFTNVMLKIKYAGYQYGVKEKFFASYDRYLKKTDASEPRISIRQLQDSLSADGSENFFRFYFNNPLLTENKNQENLSNLHLYKVNFTELIAPDEFDEKFRRKNVFIVQNNNLTFVFCSNHSFKIQKTHDNPSKFSMYVAMNNTLNMISILAFAQTNQCSVFKLNRKLHVQERTNTEIVSDLSMQTP